MLPPLVFGVMGAILVGFSMQRLARRWDRHPAALLSTAAVLLFGILFAALLQALVMYVDPQSTALASARPEIVYLAYAGVAAAAAASGALGLTALFVRAFGHKDATHAGRKSGLKAAIIGILIAVAAIPFLVQNQIAIGRAIAANEAEIAALRTSYTAGLERLVKLGVVKKIEVSDTAVTHFVTAPLYDLGVRGLAEYAKASLIYHIYVTNGEPKPVVIRNADTGRKIGTYHADGVFMVAADHDMPRSATSE